MELVAGGETLGRWIKGRPRREILDAYRQAGDALAAPTPPAWLHRDFKPDKRHRRATTVGCRVVDFGPRVKQPSRAILAVARQPSRDATLHGPGAGGGRGDHPAADQYTSASPSTALAATDEARACRVGIAAIVERGTRHEIRRRDRLDETSSCAAGPRLRARLRRQRVVLGLVALIGATAFIAGRHSLVSATRSVRVAKRSWQWPGRSASHERTGGGRRRTPALALRAASAQRRPQQQACTRARRAMGHARPPEAPLDAHCGRRQSTSALALIDRRARSAISLALGRRGASAVSAATAAGIATEAALADWRPATVLPGTHHACWRPIAARRSGNAARACAQRAAIQSAQSRRCGQPRPTRATGRPGRCQRRFATLTDLVAETEAVAPGDERGRADQRHQAEDDALAPEARRIAGQAAQELAHRGESRRPDSWRVRARRWRRSNAAAPPLRLSPPAPRRGDAEAV